MKDTEYSRRPTTIRLTEEMAEKIQQLASRTRTSQAAVIRQLLAIALRERKSIVIRQTTDVPDDVKRSLVAVGDRLADIKGELSRIGSNINIRRKKYNGERKAITDKISSLQAMMRHDETYAKIKRQAEIERLQQNLNEFDSKATSMVADDEWTRFQQLLQEFNNISMEIGEKLKW